MTFGNWDGSRECEGLWEFRTPVFTKSHEALWSKVVYSGSPDFIDRFKDSFSDKDAMGEKRVLGSTNVAHQLGTTFNRLLECHWLKDGCAGQSKLENLAHSKLPTLACPRRDYALLCPPFSSSPDVQGSHLDEVDIYEVILTTDCSIVQVLDGHHSTPCFL